MSPVAEWWQHETFIPQNDWAPRTASMPVQPRRWPRRVLILLIVVLLTAVATLGAVAWHYERSAAQWRALEERQALDLARSQSQLDLSRTAATQLQDCISALQKNRPGFVALILGQSAKVPAVCRTAEAVTGGGQP